MDLTGQQFHQQGEQINEMANTALYTNGQFDDCSGLQLNALSKTVTAAMPWYKPTTIYDPVVPDCNGSTAQDLANTPINTSSVLIQQVAGSWSNTSVSEREAGRIKLKSCGPGSSCEADYLRR